jgi:hypothetical protein
VAEDLWGISIPTTCLLAVLEESIKEHLLESLLVIRLASSTFEVVSFVILARGQHNPFLDLKVSAALSTDIVQELHATNDSWHSYI